MTVASETSRIAYTGNGVTTAFATTFAFDAAADLVVVLVVIATGVETVQALTTHYTVSGGDGSTGTVTMLTAPASTERLVIYRDPPLTQAVDLVNGSELNVQSQIEEPLDKLTWLVQRVSGLITRALRQPDGDSADIDVLPAKVTRASKFLAFDADGDPIASSGGSVPSIVISTFAETVLDDTTADAMLTTLGVTPFAQTLTDDATAAAARDTLELGTSVLQVAHAESATYASGTTTVPADDTIPQNTEGTEFLTVSITPKNASNALYIEAELPFTVTTGGGGAVSGILALFQDATAGALAVAQSTIGGNDHVGLLRILHKMTAATTSATTFKMRAGPAVAGTMYVLGNSGGRLFGGISKSRLKVTEVEV